MFLFSNRHYDSSHIGTFVLYKSTLWPFEVHVRQWECGSLVHAASCVCGFVVRDGGDVIAFDMCNGEMGETRPHLSMKNRDLSKSSIRILESYQGRKVTVSDNITNQTTDTFSKYCSNWMMILVSVWFVSR